MNQIEKIKNKKKKIMQKKRLLFRNWVVLSIVFIVVGSGFGAWAATFEYGIDPTNNRPNASMGQGYISTSRDGRLFNATAADLQQAVWYLNDTGGIIYLPRANITITETIGIESDSIRIVGAGAKNYGAEGAVIKETGTIFWVESDLPNGVFKTRKSDLSGWTFADNFILSDVTIRGDGGHNVVGVNLTTTSNAVLERVSFLDLFGVAIWGNNTHGPTFHNCRFEQCGNETTGMPAVWFTSSATYVTDPIFDSCYFEPCEYAWVAVESTPASGFNTGSIDGKVINCYFEGNGTDPEYGLLPGETWIISNNNFRGGVEKYYVYVLSAYPQQVEITDNYFISPDDSDKCIYFDTARYCSVIDNKFIDCNNGIEIANSDNITVKDNFIRGRNNDNDGYGIRVSGAYSDFITIKNNEVSNFDVDEDWIGTGISIVGGDNMLVSNNRVYYCEVGISCAGSDSVLCDNVLFGIGRSNYEFKNTGTDNIVYNNFGTEGYAEGACNTMIFPVHNNTAVQSDFDGYAWFNTSSNVLNVYNGTDWVSTTLT